MFANITHAESFLDKGDITKHGAFNNYGDQGLLERVSSFIDKAEVTINWFKHFPEHVANFTADIFAWIFKMLMLVGFQTPTFIFNNPYTQHTSLIFSSISVFIVVILTIVESFFQMTSKVTKKDYTNFYTILKRFPVAIGASLTLPYIFQWGFKLLNSLTKSISKLGETLFDGKNLSELMKVSGIDVIGMIIFDFICIGMIVPVLINSGKRYYRLFFNLTLSPLAFSAWIFNRHKHFHKQWWETIQDLAFVQVVYATFILIMGLLLYTVRFLTVDMWIFKVLIIIGALHHLANPPSFITAYNRQRRNEVGLFDTYKNVIGGVMRVKGLTKYDPTKYYRSQKKLNVTRKALRNQHGRRFVDDLLK